MFENCRHWAISSQDLLKWVRFNDYFGDIKVH